MKVFFVYSIFALISVIKANLDMHDQLQHYFDSIRACSVQYTCKDDFVPDQCLPVKFSYRRAQSQRCVKSTNQCRPGSACARRALQMKIHDFRAILAKFNVAPLATKSMHKKRHQLYYPEFAEHIDIGICQGSCRGSPR